MRGTTCEGGQPDWGISTSQIGLDTMDICCIKDSISEMQKCLRLTSVDTHLCGVTGAKLVICSAGIRSIPVPDPGRLLPAYREYSDHYSYAYCKTQT